VRRTDWSRWHEDYDADTPLARRLVAVQRRIRAFLAERPHGDLRVLSLCAGEGRDLLGVLEREPRPGRFRGRLVELDPAPAAAARERTRRAGLDGIEVTVADAGTTDAYVGAAPADLVLACGVSDEDVRRTVDALPQLCARDGVVVWTRHTGPPDLTPSIRRRFGQAGFVEVGFERIDGNERSPSVGVHRRPLEPAPLEPGVRLFRFVR
jgi:hypothetical protein